VGLKENLMGKSVIDTIPSYTIFDKVQSEMPNWTGYNSELLDQLTKTGNELIKENSILKKYREEHYVRDWNGIIGTITGLVIGIFLVGIFTWLISATDSKQLGIGYKMGQIDAVLSGEIMYEPDAKKGFVLKKEYYNNGYPTTVAIEERGREYQFSLRE